MKKIILSVLLVTFLGGAVHGFTYCDLAGDTLEAWYVQAEYREKYFEYNTFYHNATVTPGIMLRGMDQDFILRLGLPGGYFASLSANYVFQNLEALYDYNTVQTITLLAGKQFDFGPGIMLGLRYPLGTGLADNALLINRNDMYNVIAGVSQKGNFGLLKYTMQAVFEQPLRPTDYQGSMDLSASLGFNFYDAPEKQTIDIVTEINYSEIQRGPRVTTEDMIYRATGNSYALTVIPQAVVKFYNDFSFVLGVEILADADNWNLNKQEKLFYVVRANYILNSPRKASEAAASVSQSQSVFQFAAPSGTTQTAAPLSVTATPEIK